jgi:hypothetical protein
VGTEEEGRGGWEGGKKRETGGGGRGKGDRLNVNVIKCHKFFELK